MALHEGGGLYRQDGDFTRPDINGPGLPSTLESPQSSSTHRALGCINNFTKSW